MPHISPKDIASLPYGRLGLIAMESSKELGKLVDQWLVYWRSQRNNPVAEALAHEGYRRETFLLEAKTPRFGTGEAKGEISVSIRGDDIYILLDVCNYSITYNIGPYVNCKSPDDHFADLKRIIGAIGGKARRINVIMPYLYEGRQSKRSVRESLDCANALHELVNMGVENIITFDAHDPQIQNATPLHGFETVQPAYQFIKTLLSNEKGLRLDKEHFMIISPDEGSMQRAIYLANILGVDMGMFYKRLDYSVIENGRHPIAAFEFLGPSIAGKDVILVDDMISSGDTALETCNQLKEKGVGRVYLCATFGFFSEGLEKFDKAYEDGLFDKVLTTNLIYQSPELLSKPYYISTDMSKYVALIIDTLNHDLSISDLLDPVERIHRFVNRYNEGISASLSEELEDQEEGL